MEIPEITAGYFSYIIAASIKTGYLLEFVFHIHIFIQLFTLLKRKFMKHKSIFAIVLTAVLVLNSTILFAGGIITIEESRRNKTSINKTYIEKHLMRMESKIGDEMYVAIFNAEKEILYNIDMKKKNYVMITKADLEKVGSKMNNVNKLLEAKLKDLPKEQQEMMKKMLQQNMPEHEEQKEDKSYSLVNKNEKVGSWNCDKYRVKEDDEITKDVWVTDWTNSGLKDEYKNVLKSMEKFFNYFTDQLGSKVKSQSINLDFSLADKGIPVKTVYYSNGEENGSSIVKEIKETELPYSLFLVPTDFEKTNPFAEFK